MLLNMHVPPLIYDISPGPLFDAATPTKVNRNQTAAYGHRIYLAIHCISTSTSACSSSPDHNPSNLNSCAHSVTITF